MLEVVESVQASVSGLIVKALLYRAEHGVFKFQQSKYAMVGSLSKTLNFLLSCYILYCLLSTLFIVIELL